jgi:hypothetical protein
MHQRWQQPFDEIPEGWREVPAVGGNAFDRATLAVRRASRRSEEGIADWTEAIGREWSDGTAAQIETSAVGWEPDGREYS